MEERKKKDLWFASRDEKTVKAEFRSLPSSADLCLKMPPGRNTTWAVDVSREGFIERLPLR